MSGTRHQRLLSVLGMVTLGACSSANAHVASRTTATAEPVSVCAADLSGMVAATSTPAASRTALIAAVTSTEPHELLVYDLISQKTLWRKPLQVSSRPEILDDVVVTLVGESIRGLDLSTGAERFAVPKPNGEWLGATQLGQAVVFVTTTPTIDPRTRESIVSAVNLTSGKLAWQHTTRELLGKPLSAFGRVLTLSDHRELRVFEATNGNDLGCVDLVHNETADWLTRDGAGLFFGGTHAHTIDVAAPYAPHAEAMELPEVDAPLGFGPEPSDYESVPAARSAHGRVGWHVALDVNDGHTAHASADRMHFIFYRHMLAFRADGSVAWARTHKRDIVAAHATASALTVVFDSGEVVRFDAESGRELSRSALGAEIDSAQIAFDATTPNAASERPALELRQALTDMAMDPDTRLLPTRKLAIDALARLPDPEATRDLLDIATASASPESLRKRITVRLQNRTIGLEHLGAALARQYDFLEDQRAPTLSLILPALVANKQTATVPLIVDKLFDPETTSEELALCVSAIDALGGQTGRIALMRFLSIYHADSSFHADPTALVLAARALASSDDAGRAALARLIEPTTQPVLAREINALLSTPTPAAPAATVEQAAHGAEKAPSTFANAQQAFATHADDVRTCLLSELAKNPKLTEVRLSFVIHEDGHASHTQVVPVSADLDACFDPKVGSFRFTPRKKAVIDSYVISVNGLLHEPPLTAAAAKAPSEFWSLSESRSEQPALIPHVDPWWKNQNPLFISIEPQASRAPAPVAKAPVAATPSQPAVAPAKAAPATTPAPDAWWLPAK